MEAIVVDNLTKEYGRNQAIKNVSFRVKEGSVHGFLGPNGAGKSTTMKIMASLLKPTNGKVFIKGKEISEDPNYSKKIVGILPEELPLYGEMTVIDYLEFVGSLYGLQGKSLQNRLYFTLEKTLLMDVKDRLIMNLSRGYKQRVGVAQSLIFDPEVLILDEPTLGLDPASIKEMRELILELKKNHTIVLSSHLLHQVAQLCDEITIINKGEIVTSGAYDEIMERFKSLNVVSVSIALSDLSKIPKLEKDLDFIKSHEVIAKNENEAQVEFFFSSDGEYRPKLMAALVEKDVKVYSMNAKQTDLEEVFLEVTK
jgi:ABC-2 type transport system ATP-binding protein